MIGLEQQIAASELKQALEDLGALNDFVTLGRGAGLHLEWSSGAGLGGYQLVRTRIEAIVSEMLPNLQQQVLAAARNRVRAAQKRMHEALKKEIPL